MDDERYCTIDITEDNITDLAGEVNAMRRRHGRLVGLMDEVDGGIIAYVLGEDHAAIITRALNLNQTALYEQCIAIARDLMSEDGENPEYDRGQLELLADMFGVPGVDMATRKEQIEADLRAPRGAAVRDTAALLTEGLIDRIEQRLDAIGAPIGAPDSDSLQSDVEDIQGVLRDLIAVVRKLATKETR